MNFDLVRPCANCPFRSDGRGVKLRAERIVEITQAIEHQTFECHKTARRRKIDRSHCAGALIYQESRGERGDLQQVAERLGLYDPSRLDMASPVWSNVSQFLKGGSIE